MLFRAFVVLAAMVAIAEAAWADQISLQYALTLDGQDFVHGEFACETEQPCSLRASDVHIILKSAPLRRDRLSISCDRNSCGFETGLSSIELNSKPAWIDLPIYDEASSTMQTYLVLRPRKMIGWLALRY